MARGELAMIIELFEIITLFLLGISATLFMISNKKNRYISFELYNFCIKCYKKEKIWIWILTPSLIFYMLFTIFYCMFVYVDYILISLILLFLSVVILSFSFIYFNKKCIKMYERQKDKSENGGK